MWRNSWVGPSWILRHQTTNPRQAQQNRTDVIQLRPDTKSMPIDEMQTQGRESHKEKSAVCYADIP